MTRYAEGYDGIVTRGRTLSSVVGVQDPMWPPRHYVVEGQQAQIYLDALLDPAQSIPAGDESTVFDFQPVAVEGYAGVPIDRRVAQLMEIRALHSPPTGHSPKVLITGDSLTAALALFLKEQAPVIPFTPVFIGDFDAGGGAYHQGTGGQDWFRHVTSIDEGVFSPGLSAFVNTETEQLDIPGYFAARDTPDFVVMMGGTNDVFTEVHTDPGFDAVLDSSMGYLRTFVDGFLDADPSLRVAILQPPNVNPNASAYTDSGSDFATWRPTHRAYCRRVVSEFRSYSPRVEVLGTHLVIDRDSAEWGTVGPFNAVHPESNAYRRMMRAFLPWILWHTQ